MKALIALIPVGITGMVWGGIKYAAKRKAADFTENHLKKRHQRAHEQAD